MTTESETSKKRITWAQVLTLAIPLLLSAVAGVGSYYKAKGDNEATIAVMKTQIDILKESLKDFKAEYKDGNRSLWQALREKEDK